VNPQFGAPLHREVQAIAARIAAPTVHRIVITGATNASALQLSRVGVFWPKNTLCLGYPLLATLSVDHVRVVIAHELGHMTLAHGRLSSWVHRTRLSWIRLLDTLERTRSVPAHVYFLFRHYVPRLDAEAAAVSRQQELIADRLAAEVSGVEIAGQTLMAIEIGRDLFDRQFWPRVYERVADHPDPPAPFSEIGPGIWDDVEDRDEIIERVLDDDPRESDSHPPLRVRLQALNQPSTWPGVIQKTAADVFFGPQKTELAARLDARWHEAHVDEWTRRHAEIRKRRGRLAELAALSSPTRDQTFERGQLTEAEGETDAALGFYMRAYEAGLAAAGLAAGRILLDRDSDPGMELIEAAMHADPDLVEEGCELMIDFLESRGRRTEAYRYRLWTSRQTSGALMARAERSTLSVVDRFHTCADPRVAAVALSRRLALESDVVRAFLVAKELRHSLGTLTVLAIRTRSGSVAELSERLYSEGALPRDVMVGSIGRYDGGLEAALGADAMIYDDSGVTAASSDSVN
jgi:Zn-dependent protease with chaperone function